MRFLVIPPLLTACAVSSLAQTADRVYTAGQTSKTVSIIDPAISKLLGSIHLGDDMSAALSPLYPGQLLVHGPGFSSEQAPFDRPDTPITSHDRVYTADQFSNTVSVVDPSGNTTLGVIRLGNPSPNNFSPLYKGQVLVHGMGFSPDHRTAAAILQDEPRRRGGRQCHRSDSAARGKRCESTASLSGDRAGKRYAAWRSGAGADLITNGRPSAMNGSTSLGGRPPTSIRIRLSHQ
jgi:YVTN family beta-propeller protein